MKKLVICIALSMVGSSMAHKPTCIRGNSNVAPQQPKPASAPASQPTLAVLAAIAATPPVIHPNNNGLVPASAWLNG